MKLHRFIGNFKFLKSDLISRDGELVNQIKNVLRLSTGEQVVLSAGDGVDVLATIESLTKEEVFFKVVKEEKNELESGKYVTMYCSILKRENFELVVQKAVECGIKKIVPIISSRTIKTGLKIERLGKIIKEASEQCGRGIVPILEDIMPFAKALEVSKKTETRLFFDISGENKLVRTDKEIAFFIGPEGGWTETEISLAKESGCQIIGLGPRTLRGETAAIIASYLTVNI